jgi:hypothetical protein
MTAACLLAAAAASLRPGLVRAQEPPLQFTPSLGVAVPLGKVYEQTGAGIRHRTGLAFGGRLSTWIAGRVGLEVAISYALSGYRVDTASQSFDTTGAVLAASGRVLVRFARIGGTAWHLTAGVGVVKHSGTYVAHATGRTNLAGVLGLAGTIPLSRQITIVVSAEDYVYRVALAGFTGALGSTRQLDHEMLFSVGWEFPLGARGDDDWHYRR